MKPYNAKVIRVSWFDKELWSLGWVNQIWIKDIELVTLHCLWWRIIVIIVCLVVLVPIITRLDTIEVSGLSRIESISSSYSCALM